MWENSHLNPRELTSFFGALSPLAMGGGTLPSPAQDFKRQSHDRSRGSTCSSQVQGQSARIKAGLGTASLAPRPLPPTRHTPASACPKTKCGLLVAESHVTGVVLVGEVMNAVRKHKQNDGGYPSMHVILCLAASLCLCPPAHHTPRVHTTHTHTHTHTLRRPLRLAASLSACTIPRHTPGTHTHTPPAPHGVHTRILTLSPPPHKQPMNTQPPHAHPYNVCTHAHAHTQSVVLCLAVTLCLCLCPHATHASPHTHTRIPPRPDPHTTPHPPPPHTHTHCVVLGLPVSLGLCLFPRPPSRTHRRTPGLHTPTTQHHLGMSQTRHTPPPAPPPQHTDTRPTPRTYACARTHTHTRGRTHSAVLCLAV